MMPCFMFHDWGKWKAYTWKGRIKAIGILAKYGSPDWDDVTVERQKRECERCGLTQDIEVER